MDTALGARSVPGDLTGLEAAAGHLADSRRPRKLLVLDTSYALEAIRARGIEDSVTCRDLDGFFDHVWSVHPFATLVTSDSWARRYGKPQVHSLGTAHTFIEGKVGKFERLRRFPGVNFLLAQLEMFVLLFRLVRRERITVIRAGDPLYLGVFSWALARLCRIPFVVRVSGNYDKIFALTGKPVQPRVFSSRRIEKIAERFVLARADLVAAPNNDNLEFAWANGARRETSAVFRYGNLIAREHFTDPATRPDGRALLAELSVEPGAFVLAISRLEPLKLLDDIIRVLAEVRRRGHDVKAVFVGDGVLRSELGELAAEQGVGEHVVFCGNRDQRWISQVIPLAACVVSTLTGRALSEAALGAAPIAAYDSDWQGEIIEAGVTGTLVPERAWRELADAVDHYLRDPAYAKTMGVAVRKRALEMLDPAMLNQHEREHYTALFTRTSAA